MEQEYSQPETITKKYLRNYTEEGREKQKAHLKIHRQKNQTNPHRGGEKKQSAQENL